MSDFVWSNSSLECFEVCPKQFYHKYILREKEAPSKALIEGRAVHESLEAFLHTGGETPVAEKYLPLARSVRNQARGKKLAVEMKMGVTKNLEACGFFGDKAVYGRSAADFIILNYPNAFLGDWKTGKVREKKEQLTIMALFIFKHYPRIEKIVAANIWLETGKVGEAHTFTREHEAAMWAWLLGRIQRLEKAIDLNTFCMTPGPLCNWCPVKSCPNNRS